MSQKILTQVSEYYSEKVIQNGATPRGVDWNSNESHQLRFKQLCKVIDTDQPFSVLDYGCGYGALADFISPLVSQEFEYTGFDISHDMIETARKIHRERKCTFLTSSDALEGKTFDYGIASGIFNVKLKNTDEEWQEYVLQTVNHINSLTTRGFAFNILTSYSDKEYQKSYLHYADPLFYFDYCKRKFSKYVSLLHDYPLYEFSILVRK